jgi:dolichyl-phosphate-mannose-protein mannosyltransferase
LSGLTDSPTLKARIPFLILLLWVTIFPTGCGAWPAAAVQNGKLAGCLAGIAMLCIVGYGLFICIQPLFSRRDSGLGLAILILIGIWVLKQSLMPLFPGVGIDVGSYIAWAQRVTDIGPARTYQAGYFLDYPPGYLYALWAAGVIAKLVSAGGDTTRLLVESPALIADFLVALVMFAYLRRAGHNLLAYAGMLMVALNPALLFDSVIWGQSDSVPTLLMLLSVTAMLEDEYELSWALAAIGVLVKPQVLLFLPVLGLWTLMRVEPRRWLSGALAAILAFVIGAAPFQKGHPWSWLPSLYFATTGYYHETSVNAFNFMALAAGLRQADTTTIYGIPCFPLGMGLLMLIYAGVAWMLWRKPSAQNLIFGVFIALFGSFMFAPRMHERYLYPALVFIVPLALEDPMMLAVFGVLSLTCLFNLAYIKRTLESPHDFLDAHDSLAMLASAVNMVIFGLAAPFGLGSTVNADAGSASGVLPLRARLRALPELVTRAPVKEKESAEPLGWVFIDTVAIVVLVAFATAIHFWRIGKPAEVVFDEVHFVAEQARHYLRNEPFLDPHPPLAKLLIALSIWIFGDHPWSWRVPNAIIGTALVAITYLLGRRMFRSRLGATVAAGLVACDGVFLVDSRIAVIDIVYITCAAASYLLLFRFLEMPDGLSRRRTLIWMGIALGLCLASKLYIPAATFLLVMGFLVYALWTGKGTSSGRPAPPPVRYRMIGGSAVLASAVGAIVYIAVFLPHVWLGWWGGIADLFHYYGQVIWYERSVSSATHPYASPWWSWPLMLRPVAYWQDFPKTGKVSTIWFGGNPAAWWGALTAILVIGIEAIERGTLWRSFLAIGYLTYLMIWVPIGRTLFLYHYMPSVYLGYLALAAVLTSCWRDTAEPWTHIALLLTLAPVFLLGLPSGWSVLALVALAGAYAATSVRWPEYAGKMVFVSFVATVLVLFVYFFPVWVGIPIERSAYYARMWLQGPGLRDWI